MLQTSLAREHLLYRIADRIRQSLELDEILAATVEEIRAFLRVDRVKIYRFEDDGSGQVVAESVDDTRLPSLKGLHFPATDIPPHARELFVQVRQRVIVDVDAQRKAVSYRENGNASDPEDLRYSSVDPCHIEYLLAMGVRSSTVVPILHHDKLWGLLAIHHATSRRFGDNQLQSIQLLVDQVSIAIAQSYLLEAARNRVRHEATVNRISTLLHSPLNLVESRQMVLEETVAALEGSGGRLYLLPEPTGQPAQIYVCGAQPRQSHLEETEAWRQLVGWEAQPDNLDDRLAEELRHSQRSLLVEAADLDSRGSWVPYPYTLSAREAPLTQAFEDTAIRSVLTVPLQYRHQCLGWLSVFRDGYDTSKLWAGRWKDDQRNLLPRNSFEAWQEIRRSQVAEWSDDDIKLARSVGIHLYMAAMQKRVEALLRHQASHDALTQLPNRVLFDELLSLALVWAIQNGEMLGVGFLDLDRFKNVNDILGHGAGDRLLQHVARRLQNVLRTEDTLARWGGDEFTLLLPRLESAEELARLGQKILDAFVLPFQIDDREFYITASLGIAVAPYDGEEATSLLQNADAAMYRAKQQGRNNYQLYSPEMNQSAIERLVLEADLRKALFRDEFVLHYQPQIDLQTGKIIGVEALLRWHHDRLGWISPGQFIPIAEETGLICEIGEWVLKTACEQHQQWQKFGLQPIKMAVNLSARQFQQPELLDTILGVLEETGMEPGDLEIEITETTAVQNMELTAQILDNLKGIGIGIALDDFGIGYSSLNSLKHLPLSKLKIDRAFVRDITENANDAAIAKTIVSLGCGLNLQVLAEGVETPEQLNFLRSIRCHAVQGYWLSKPLNADKTERLLQTWSPHQSIVQPLSGFRCELLAPQTNCEHIETLEVENRILKAEIESLKRSAISWQQQAKREQVTASIAKKIRKSLHLEEILQVTVDEGRDFLDCDRALLYRFESDWSGVMVVESVAAPWKSVLGAKVEDPCFTQNYVEKYKRGRVQAIEDLDSAHLASCHRQLLNQFQVKANLVVPVHEGDTLWGLLLVHQCRGPRVWHDDEISLVKQLATQLAIAIQQAELYRKVETANQQLQRLATLDGLTQTANRRQFDDYLDRHWTQASRERQPLSLILCDVDRFKLYNDTYGHQAGDRCLQHVANAIGHATKRPTDLLARYGGEEFAVILPDTHAAAARRIAAEIRVRVKALGIVHDKCLPDRCVSLSVGVSTCIPNEEFSTRFLIETADRALYSAKTQGRDRVVFRPTKLAIAATS